jgi:hypothetical protein
MMPDPTCWAATCTLQDTDDLDRAVYNSQQEHDKPECHVSVNICNEVFKLVKDGKVTFQGNTFQNLCGDTGGKVPGGGSPSSPPDPSPHPTPSPGSASSSQTDLYIGLSVAAAVILLILVSLWWKRRRANRTSTIQKSDA